MDLNSFRTNTPDALPLLHFILHTADLKLVPTNRNAFMQFLHRVITNPNPLFKANPADGLDCTLQSSSGQKAGEMFPKQAVLVLCWACEMGDMRVVMGMLAAGTDVNQCNDNDLSPLMYASQAGSIDVIRTLLSHGADVNLVNTKQKNCLLLACENKEWKAAIALYQHVVETDVPLEDFNTKSSEFDRLLFEIPLYQDFLRHKFSDYRDELSVNDRAFVTAMEYHGVAYTQHVANINPRAHAILIREVSFSDACRYGYDLVIKHHTRHKYLTQNDIMEALKVACSNNQLVVLPILLPYLNCTSVSTLITHAYQHGHYQFGNELFESCKEQSTLPCPDVSITDACKADNMDLVKFLIKHGKNVNAAANQLGFVLKYEPMEKTTLMRVLLGHVDPDPATSAEDGSKTNVVSKDPEDSKSSKDSIAVGEDSVTANESSASANEDSTAVCKDNTTTWEDNTAASEDSTAIGEDTMTAGKDNMTASEDSMTAGEDSTAAGEDSITAGEDSTAAGEDSTAAGEDSTAPGEDSTAAGEDSMTASEDSITAGEDSTAAGEDSTAAGEDSMTAGEGSMTAGEDRTAASEDSTAAGEDSTAAGEDSTAAGEDSTAPGEDSTAAGEDSTAAGEDSTAPGEDSTAAGEDSMTASEDSMAAGEDSMTASEDSMAAGKGNTISYQTSMMTCEDSTAAGEDRTTTSKDSMAADEGITAAGEKFTWTNIHSMATVEYTTASAEDSTAKSKERMDAGEENTDANENSTSTYKDNMTMDEDTIAARERSTTTCKDKMATSKDYTSADDDSTATVEGSTVAGAGKNSMAISERNTTAGEANDTSCEDIKDGKDSKMGEDLKNGDCIKNAKDSTFDSISGSRNTYDDSEYRKAVKDNEPGDGKTNGEDDDDTYGRDRVSASLDELNDHNCHPPLVYACMQGNIAAVKLLLQHGADISIHSDETPLTAACKHGYREIVDILFSNTPTPSISEKNMYGMTPLQVAVKHQHGMIAKMLIKKYGADPNEYKDSGSQFTDVTLHVKSSYMRSFSFVKESSVCEHIKDTVPTNEIHRHGWSLFTNLIDTDEAAIPPIVTAFCSKQYDLVKFLMGSNTLYKPLFKLASLQETCQLESVPLIHEFIHSGVEETRMNYQSAFEVVVELGSIEVMRYFLSIMEEDTRILASALIHACEVGSEHMVRLLIQQDRHLVKTIQHDSSETCYNPLCICIRNYDISITKMLHKCGAQLFNGAPVEETLPHHTLCQVSLRELCSRQDEFSDILPLLLPDHINQSSLNHGLIAACNAACTRAARLFLSRSADVNCCDDDGMTPLHAAIHAQSSEVVALLLAAGADPDKAYTMLLVADEEGKMTPLHPTIHVKLSGIEAVLLPTGTGPDKSHTLLVEKDNPFTSCIKHMTPLNSACELEHCEIATKLIDAGANTNPESLSPLLTACKHNYLDIVQLLLDNKAYPNHTSSEGHILRITHRAKHYEAARLLMEYGTFPGVLIVHECLDLKSACELGYTEVAQRIAKESQGQVSRDLLDQCIQAAFKNGFLKAMFEVFLETDDQDYCMQLAQALLLSTAFTVESDAPEQSGVIVCDNNNSLWECLQKKNIARMRELIKAGHDVNIPNAAGRSLLQECIQQGIAHVIPDLCTSPTQVDIDHRDSAGRTALFYSLTSPYIIQHKNVSVFEYLVSQGADVNVSDVFGRTVLHEWQPVSDGTRRGPSLQTLIHHIDINNADCKGQTALHIAVLDKNISKVRQLVEHGGDLEAHDINGITPIFLAALNESMLRVVHKYHPNHNIVARESASDEDDSKQCVHMLKDKSKQHRLIPELEKVYRERMKSSQTDNFASKYAERVYYIMQASIHEEKLTFENTVIHMLQEINAMVVQEEPVLSFIPRLSGSCAEGTKVIAMDEADMLCVFDHDFWRHVTLSPVVNDSRIHDNPSFVQITSLSTEYQHLFSKNGVISKQKLLCRLYSLIRKALPTVLKSINRLYMIDVKTTVANDHSLACLSMVWHGEHLPWQEFTVDIVPAIPVTQEQLPDATRLVLSHSHIIQDLFVVPKTGTFDQSQNDAAFRLSFSSTERDLFLAMPATLKQGYMLTKVLVHDCFTVDNIHPSVCSYNLKTATFECFKANLPNWDTMVPCARKTDRPNETKASAEDVVVKHAQQILERLEKNFAQKHQSSFFLKRCDLMVHNIDKNDYRQMLYVKYCLAVLSDTNDAAWQNLADYVAEQLLLSENLHESSFLHEIEILLDMGLKSLKNSVLCAMIKVGQVAGVKMLLERGASVGDVGDTSALQLAQTHQAHDVRSFLEDTVKGIFNILITGLI